MQFGCQSVDAATQAHGLATTGGTVAYTRNIYIPSEGETYNGVTFSGATDGNGVGSGGLNFPFDGIEDFLAHIDSRLHLVPRYRQKLAFPRFEMGRPLWVDDPRFNIGYHVRHTALPSPGGVEQLRLLVRADPVRLL